MDMNVVWPPHGRFEVSHIDRVLLLPLQDCIEVAADVLVVEVGEWHLLDIYPVVQDWLDRRAACQCLQDNLQTVRHMCSVRRGGDVIDKFSPVVVIEVDFLAEIVQTVDLVEDVKSSDMGVITKTKIRWVFCGCQRVDASLPDVLGGHRNSVDVGEPLPSSIDFWRRALAKDGWMGWFGEGTITADLDKWNVDLVKERSFRDVSHKPTYKVEGSSQCSELLRSISLSNGSLGSMSLCPLTRNRIAERQNMAILKAKNIKLQ